jgi:hypothetical protein
MICDTVMRLAYLTTKIGPFAGIVALTGFLASCSSAASGATFKDSSFATGRVADGKGRIIFYRQADGNFRWVTLEVDDSIVGTLGQRGFLVIDVAPGEHRLAASLRYLPGEYAIKITVSAGETYYIRASHRPESRLYSAFAIGGILLVADPKGVFQLEGVPAVIASVDVEELRLSE